MIAITLNRSYIAVYLTKYRIFTCIHSRRINITLARIRMQCSELLYHLHQNHVADSPNCPCGVIETHEHYFFDCPQHHIAREELTAELFQLQITPTLNHIYNHNPEIYINYVKFTGLNMFSNLSQYALTYYLLIRRWVRSLLVSISVATRVWQNKLTSTFTLQFLVADIIVMI